LKATVLFNINAFSDCKLFQGDLPGNEAMCKL